MNTQQNIVAGGGVALIAANFWTQQRPALTSGALNPKASTGQLTASHRALYSVGAEILFVGVATILAGTNRTAANALVAVIVGLGLLFVIRHYGGSAVGSAPPGFGSTGSAGNLNRKGYSQ